MLFTKVDEQNMAIALEMARQALSNREVPVGAVVVDKNGLVLAKASNQTEQMACQTGHAEVLAITQACKARKDWRLDGCFLYVTLQPCLMCFGLASLSRMTGIYYGAESSLYGYNLEPSVLAKVYQGLAVIPGLKAADCIELLTSGFKKSRGK